MMKKELKPILDYVKKTNPHITEEKLWEILKKSNKYFVSALAIISNK